MKVLRAFALMAVALSALAYDFTPPRIPAGKNSPRWEKLLRTEVNYLLQSTPEASIPNELEHALRPLTATALSAATCVKFAGCESNATKLAVRILADVTRTHITGGGKTASGRPWGHHWQSALWAWQAAFGAWLIWPDVPPATRQAVIAMTIDEADRFLDMPAPYSRFSDTKAEENAWNSLILVLASEAIVDHPHRARWRERALEYMVTAFATPNDLKSDKPMDGRPLHAWLRGANVHSDFTLENHGFVHPDYMTTTSRNLGNAVVYKLLGKPVPDAVTHNAREIYANIKFFSMPDGGLLYPSGTDWSLHRLDMTAELHVQMERILGDRDAGALADLALGTLEKMQARNANGRTFVPGEYPSYAGHEPHAACLYAFSLMTARLWDAPAEVRTAAEVWTSLQGARIFDDAHMFVMRTPGSVSSFSWGLRTMGQTVPFTPDPIVNPINHSYAGLATPIDGAADKPGRLGIGSVALDKALAGDPITVSTVISGYEAGAAHVTVRATHSDRQHTFSFTALANGTSVYLERWARTPGALGGLLSFTEENAWVYGSTGRRIEHDGRTWLNVDGRLGYAVSGGGGIRVVPDVRNKLIVLNDNAAGDTAIVTLPGANVEKTKQFAARDFRLKVDNPDIIAVAVDGRIIASNFSRHPTTVTINGGLRIPLNGYMTRIVKQP